MKLIAPAGIGDWSWIWSKLVNVKDEIRAVRIIDGAPRRTVPYVQVCGVLDAGYDVDVKKDGEVVEHAVCGTNYWNIILIEQAAGLDYQSKPTWAKVRKLLEMNPNGTIPLEANQHLEQGWPLAEWMADLPTNYHYPLYVSLDEKASGVNKTMRAIIGDGKREFGHPMKEGPVVGVSCASYKGAEAWATWGADQWTDMLKRIMALGWRPLLIGGAWDDLTYTIACALDLPSTVGKTSVPEMVAQMDYLDAYIGYSSGMNVIRTVLNKPAMALWPANEKCDQSRLMWSWAPPHMIESGRYQAVTWRPVDDIWPVARQFLRRCEKEISQK